MKKNIEMVVGWWLSVVGRWSLVMGYRFLGIIVR